MEVVLALPLSMAERGSINHPSGLPETELVSGEESGNVGLVEALDPYLKGAEKCIEAVQKIPSRKFNRKQCEYLAQKLEEVVRSISTISEVSRARCHGSSSCMNVSGGVEIVRLVLALAKQIESFVLGCCKDEWIQSAMALTNVSEYVSSVGFNLELCRVAFRKECAATAPLTLDEVDGIYRGEVEIVETKATADVDVLFDQLILKMPSLSDENKDLATYLLQRLRRVRPETSSAIPKYSLVSADDGGFSGKLFKRVQEIGRLGTCGSGATVDKATWLGTLVAVKTFYGPEDSEFIKEVDIIRRLCHPNITSMFCSAMDRHRCSIVMELMDEDLLALMQRRLDPNIDSPPFSIWEAIDIMLQIGEGVNYLHLHTIVHRDLKSMNILVKSVEVGGSEIRHLQVKVADFGLSKLRETNTRFSTQTPNRGTHRWMAPETIQLTGVGGSLESHSKNAKMPKYPRKMDVYSFAMVCYEILTGKVPFYEISLPTQVKRKILNGDRPQLPDHCPQQLKTLIEECWNQEPVKRPTFAAICKRLKWIKYLLMTSYHLTIEEPLQREHVSDSQHPLEPRFGVFISGSSAQKHFAEHLWLDLKRYDRMPFYDLSEPIAGYDSKQRDHIIVDTIRKCLVGIVIVSEEYFLRSKWPMLELVTMVKEMRKPYSRAFMILPVFYTMSPHQLYGMRTRLKKCWQEWANHDKLINVEEWMSALQVLMSINGLSLRDINGEISLQKDIVRTICVLSPPLTNDFHHVQGKSRLYQVIRKKINPENISKVHVIGLHGMAGIGKTTMCKVLCDELSEDFLGKVCYAELKTQSEVEVLRHVLSRLTNLSDKLLSEVNIDQYYKRLQNHIHQHRVLLVIDNVPDSLKAIEAAKRYLKAEYAPGSVVLVATRSLGILQSLNIDERDCLEMPKLEEEEARSLFLYYAAPEDDVDPKLLERCLRSAEHFFGEDDEIFSVNMMPCEDDDIHYHYHPVALKELGMQLGILTELWERELTTLKFSRFRMSFDMLTLDSRYSFFGRSFDLLSLEDQLLLMDAALFYPEPSQEGSTVTQLNIFTWLSLLHGKSVDAIMTRLEVLKNKLLLEHSGDGSTRIAMHPLVRQFCESKANVGKLASRRWVFNDSKILEELPENNGWENMRRICFTRGDLIRKKISLKYCTNVTVLKLVRCHVENYVSLDLSPLTRLKSLEIISCTSPVEILGLGLLSNLLFLRWDNIPSRSPCIEEIGLLTELRILGLDSSENENKLPDLSRLSLLREAAFRFGNGVDTNSGLIRWETNSLQFLDLGGCHRLCSCPSGIGAMVALQELDLNDCLELEKLPNLQNLTNLKKLNISGCRSIMEVPGLHNLVALQELDLCNCSLLRKLPRDLRKLGHLQKLKMRRCLTIRALLGLGDLVALEELDLEGCSLLQKLSYLGNLGHLRKLNITDCCLIETVPGLNDLTSLQEFRAERCSGLVELPDIRRLTNLLVLNLTSHICIHVRH